MSFIGKATIRQVSWPPSPNEQAEAFALQKRTGAKFSAFAPVPSGYVIKKGAILQGLLAYKE
jgi:hypothetical protein